MRRFKFGWYGDNNLGEHLIQMILRGEKTASVCPAYDPQDADLVEGERMLLVDKHGNVRGQLLVTRIESRRLDDVDEALASQVGSTIEDLREALSFANGRAMKPEEELRVTHFQLLAEKPAAR
ncbi:MAG: ASCH domain-containing protein [Elusimicrobia bacterium]|nr:ASCH domain-containing protein [Elusimicrobiota bacterium]